MNFKELCNAYEEFMKILEQKSEVFCNINRLIKPFGEEITDIDIGENSIVISYRIYSYGDYDCESLEILMSFFEDETEEMQKVKEKYELLQKLEKELVKLDDEKQRLEKHMNAMQRDIEDMMRLSRIYEIQKSEKFLEAMRETNMIRTKYDEISMEIQSLNLRMNKIRN